MIRRRLWASLIGIVGVPVIVLAAQPDRRQRAGARSRPAGRCVRRPGAVRGGARDDDLVVIRDLIRDELENRGIAEPDVRVEG